MNDEFVKKIVKLCGNKGKKWLDTLPDILKTYEQKWDIRVSSPFPLSYNYVASAKTREEKDVVLKISFPDNHEFAAEIEALKFFHGDAAIKILKEDLPNGVVLLELAIPGIRLRDVTPDSDQIHITANVLKKLHKPIIKITTPLFPTINDWAKAFTRYSAKYSQKSGPVPRKLFERGEEIFNEYLKEKKEQVLLHGDLHSDNILSSDRGWLVIDPKGIIGEAEFELGAYLRNPYYDYPKGSDYKKLETDRILQFSEELGFDKERLRNWAFACAVISLLWFLEDENNFKDIYVRNAELIKELNL